MDRIYTVDVYNTKTKRVIDLKLKQMTYKQARTFRGKFGYRKHNDPRIRRIR